MVMPGNVEFNVELITPIAMDKELRFAIRKADILLVQVL